MRQQEHAACQRRISTARYISPGNMRLAALCRQRGPVLTQARPACCLRATPPSRAMEGDGGVSNPRDGREGAKAAATARAAHGAASGAGAAASQDVSSGSPPSPRGGIISRVWETLAGSPKGADAQLSTSPPSPGAFLLVVRCGDHGLCVSASRLLCMSPRLRAGHRRCAARTARAARAGSGAAISVCSFR